MDMAPGAHAAAPLASLRGRAGAGRRRAGGRRPGRAAVAVAPPCGRCRAHAAAPGAHLPVPTLGINFFAIMALLALARRATDQLCSEAAAMRGGHERQFLPGCLMRTLVKIQLALLGVPYNTPASCRARLSCSIFTCTQACFCI